MANPHRGIIIAGRFYNYHPDSYRENIGIRNNAIETQFDRSAVVMGIGRPTFTIAVHLENQYNVVNGSSLIGQTFWSGISRLQDMKDYLGGTGPNMPITFVCPYGVTYNVIPVGSLDLNIYNSNNPGLSGIEFIANISFAGLSS